MPKIPRIVSQVRPQGRFNARVTAADTGGITGAALQNLGAEVTRQSKIKEDLQNRAAAAEAQAKDQVLKREGQTLAIRNAMKFQREEAERFNQATIANQENPDGFTENYLGDIDKSLDALKSQSDNKFYQDHVEDLFLRMQPQIINRSMLWEANQKTAVQRQRLEETNGDRQFILQKSPEQYETERSSVLNDIKTATENGIVKNSIAMKDKQITEIAGAALGGYVARNDFAGAREFLEKHGKDFGATFGTARKAMVAAEKAFNKQVDATVTMGELVNGEVIANPKNPKHRDAFDSWYGSIRDDFESGDATAVQVVAEAVRRTNVIGNDLKSDVQGLLAVPPTSEENVEILMKGASFLAGIGDTNKQAYESSFSKQEKEIADFYDSRVDMGMTQEDIKQDLVKFITRDPITVKVQGDRKSDIEAQFRSKKGRDIIPTMIEKSFGEDLPPNTRDRLRAEAESIYISEFMEHGDMGVAKKSTERHMDINYRRSGAGYRGSVLKFAPEALAPHWFNHLYSEIDWAGGHLKDKAKAIGLTSKDYDEIYVVPDNDTALAYADYRADLGNGKMADSSLIKYPIWVEKDGEHDILEDQNGNPLTVSYDMLKISKKLKMQNQKKRVNGKIVLTDTEGEDKQVTDFGVRFFGGFK